MKLWQGRLSGEVDERVNALNSSIGFDSRMYKQDILGSTAHAEMLGRCGIIESAESAAIVEGLSALLEDIESGKEPIDMSAEDIHTFVEAKLTERIGEAGKRLHTARSRNDQVATDLRLYLADSCDEITAKAKALALALCDKAKAHTKSVMPGYTHMQRAQPVLFAHHMLAYFAMLERDFKRLEDCYDMCDMSPIGACALAGTTYPTHPEEEANDLHFASVYGNSLDAVSDRDYLLQFLSFASICAMHLSRLSEEFIYWSTSEFQFIELDDGYSTGSSIMPQKKNPDMCELIRGKTGRVYGHLIGLLTVMKGLPLAYDKDMQEDKEGVFDALDTLYFALDIYAGMISTMTVNGDHTRQVLESDFSNATDMADYLAKKGLPFRQAHAVVGSAVHYCIEHHKVLLDLSMEEFRSMSPLFEEDIKEALSIENCVKNRESYGGTGPKSVERQQTHAEKAIASMKEAMDAWKQEMAFLG